MMKEKMLPTRPKLATIARRTPLRRKVAVENQDGADWTW